MCMYAIEVDIWKNWIMWQVVSKFGSLKIDDGGDTGISFDTIYYHTTCLNTNVHLPCTEMYTMYGNVW